MTKLSCLGVGKIEEGKGGAQGCGRGCATGCCVGRHTHGRGRS